ncbi:pentatricopeptide repeat-containing protein At1g26900, mitochondrial [Amborella trichopoda]|uniref:pentatricopeptide repeat-containing protein At1g26900, mitochondrial n=1 Tax=Amborella trichopoda TaxID=13333 RepID=UPI0005D3A6AE|nr:pentatricopeptide repeat-containing protein At1g26900, mitochondrial [Amborella trichopoda]|eukprot:XP_011624043.1 pentatricopeptide repeat-containing protein At1g26900, mitochondrial [Amborella trichopoda]
MDQDPFPLSKLLASYALSAIDQAFSIFSCIRNPNLFMWNTMLRGISVSETPEKSLSLFNSMRAQGILLDQFTIICILKSCAKKANLETGQCIHGLLFKTGFGNFINPINALIHMYAAGKRVDDAHQVFNEMILRDAISWNSLLGGYVKASRFEEALSVFREMSMSKEMVCFLTMVILLSGFRDLKSLNGGKSAHSWCFKSGICLNLKVGSALLEMYGKCGFLDSAKKVFDEFIERDVVSWNSIISGYVKAGLYNDSIALFHQMLAEGFRANNVTMVCVLEACTSLGVLTKGELIHDYIKKEELHIDAVLGTGLINMYIKCGCVDKAIEVFSGMKEKDVRAYSALIMGLGVHGRKEEALELFSFMVELGVKPNEVTYLAVLTACSHGGLVEEGKMYFKSMVCEHGLKPGIEHYGCMVDLLGRAGLLEEAREMVESMPMEYDGATLRALLNGCRIHGNVELGELVREKVLKVEPQRHPGDAILVSSLYASKGQWSEVERVRSSVEEKGVKEVGWSSIVN